MKCFNFKEYDFADWILCAIFYPLILGGLISFISLICIFIKNNF